MWTSFYGESSGHNLCKRCGPQLSTSDFQSEVSEVFGEIGGELPAKFGRRFSSFLCWGKWSEVFSTKTPLQISPSLKLHYEVLGCGGPYIISINVAGWRWCALLSGSGASMLALFLSISSGEGRQHFLGEAAASGQMNPLVSDLAHRALDVLTGTAGIAPDDYPFVCRCDFNGICMNDGQVLHAGAKWLGRDDSVSLSASFALFPLFSLFLNSKMWRK